MDEDLKRDEGGAVAESSGDTDIDRLLRARNEIDATLRRHKAEFTVLFTDIVGSTSFFERFGDTAGLMMLERHNELVLPALAEGGGTVVKTIGDAVLAVFASPMAAVRTAIQVQQRLEAHNEDLPADEQIFTRVGLNFGQGFVKEKDIFGDVVNVAARIVKTCAPAQILVSGKVYEAVEKKGGLRFVKLGSAALHGKAAPEELYEVMWTSPERYERLRQRLDAGGRGAAVRYLLGRYEILDELGRGAMGVVYKAYDPLVGRMVAFKTVRLTATGSERDDLIRRLRQEAQAAGRLEHPNIVTIYDASEAEGMFYVTMQLVKGRTLAELIAGRTLLPLRQILLLLIQVCDGLDYAHEQGIVHRDLKPSNILVTREGTAKIVDFGIAKIAEAGTTQAGTVLGTPSYMSPEQAQGARVDRRSDVFSLGSILYELLTGEKAFPGNTPTSVLYKIVHEEPIPPRVMEPSLLPSLERVVSKALAKDLFQRYQSCRQMQADLKAALEVAPATARGLLASVPRPAVKKTPRRGLAWVAALAVMVGALLSWQQGWLPVGGPAPTPSGPAVPAQRIPSPTASGSDAAPPPATAREPAEKTPPEAAKPAPTEPAPARPQPGTTGGPTEKAEADRPAATKASRAAAKPASSVTSGRQEEINRWLLQAEQYTQQGRYAEALFALEQVLRLDPQHKQAKEQLQRVRQMEALREQQPR